MFSEALVGVRDASCRTSGLYTDLIEEGGDSAVTEAQTVEKKPSCVHNPDDERPGPDVAICPLIVSSNVGI